MGFFFADGFLEIILHIHAGADNRGFIIPMFFSLDTHYFPPNLSRLVSFIS